LFVLLSRLQYAFLADRTGGPGLTWGKLGEGGNGMLSVLVMCVIEALVFMWLGYYSEQVRLLVCRLLVCCLLA
jgi:hypothetical protein